MKRPIRLFPNTVKGVVEGIRIIFEDEVYADKAVEELLKENKKWGKRDRSFVAENIYGIVRYWRKLWAIYGADPCFDEDSLFNVFGIWWLLQDNQLPEWEEFNTLQNFDVKEKLSFISEDIHVMESFPEWMAERAILELGQEWNSIATNLNLVAPVALRPNFLRGGINKVKVALKDEDIEFYENEAFPDVLFLEKRPNLRRLDSYTKGLYEIQDAGSQEIAKFLNVKSGNFVVDACSGAGGKALHIAALMRNIGKIVSLDIYPRKLSEQNKRAKRNGVRIIHTDVIKGESTINRLEGKADVLLLDVPCSGTGVIRREPDTKWKLTEDKLEEVIGLQQDLLSDYTKILRRGGTLVYATCSILKSENEEQVDWFLEHFSDFSLEESKRLNPGPLNDGFYMARFIKK